MSKYSEIEIQIAKKLHDAGYKWLGRDKDGGFYAYSGKPYKSERCWVDKGNGRLVFVSGNFTQIFQSIEWTDNEPTYIEDIISPQVLDDVERRYLSAVIRPFRDRVVCISKSSFAGSAETKYQYILIIMSDRSYDMDLPIFEKGTMYKGMIEGKIYTPEELRLNLGDKK